MALNPVAEQLAALASGNDGSGGEPAGDAAPAAEGAPPSPAPPPEGSGDVGSAGEGEDPAGNPLLKALQTERAERKELKRQLDELQKAQMTDQERLVAGAREAGKTEALGQYQGSLARAAVTAQAAVFGCNDPADAAAHLDLSGLNPDDSEAVKAAVEELGKSKPYLLKKTSSTPKIPTGQQGAAAGGTTFNDLIRQGAKR